MIYFLSFLLLTPNPVEPMEEIPLMQLQTQTSPTIEIVPIDPPSQPIQNKPEGFSIDLGALYTWMNFTKDFSGSTGGPQGKITYQAPKSIFGQLRSIYNTGTLSSPHNHSHDYEWYTEILAGYCFPAWKNLTLTPYAGLGLDFIHDNESAYSTITSLGLRYRSYYALFGFDAHYTWSNWTAGLQADCFPIFNQYLNLAGLAGAYWSLKNRVGFDVRLPVSYRLYKNLWFELAPYYRLFPIGSSSVLSLQERTLNEWGFFGTFRFFLP